MPTIYYTDGTSEKKENYNLYYKKGRDFNDKNTNKLIKDRIIKTNSININGIIHNQYIKHCTDWPFILNIIPQINNSFLKELQKDFLFVKKFYMSNNLIKDNELDFTMFKNLEKIKLSINLLTEIPESIFTLKKLKKLVIRGISSLEMGDCVEAPNSYITNIPKKVINLQNLLILDLSSQLLSSLPSEFKELKNLKKLYLSDNMFLNFPIEICSLINLEILEMTRNLSKLFPIGYSFEGEDTIEIQNTINAIEENWRKRGNDYMIPNEIINLQKLKIFKTNFEFKKFPKYFLEKMNIEELEIAGFIINNYTHSELYEILKIKKKLTISSPKNIIWYKTYKLEIIYNEKNNIIIITNEKNLPRWIGYNPAEGRHSKFESNLEYKLIKKSESVIELSIYNNDSNKFTKCNKFLGFFDIYPQALKELDWEALLDLYNEQTQEMCLAAVQNDSNALENVRNQTPEICLVAVQNFGRSLKYVENQTYEMCLIAVQKDVTALQYVKDQTPELCLAAVQNDGMALEYVKNQTLEICLAAVQKNGNALEYVKKQTLEICLAAIKNNNDAFKFVKNKTQEICLIAKKKYTED